MGLKIFKKYAKKREKKEAGYFFCLKIVSFFDQYPPIHTNLKKLKKKNFHQNTHQVACPHRFHHSAKAPAPHALYGRRLFMQHHATFFIQNGEGFFFGSKNIIYSKYNSVKIFFKKRHKTRHFFICFPLKGIVYPLCGYIAQNKDSPLGFLFLR